MRKFHVYEAASLQFRWEVFNLFLFGQPNAPRSFGAADACDNKRQRGGVLYRLLPFTVPVATALVTVEFDYSAKDQHTALDLGLFDPHGFRGWSGGNK